MNPSKPSNIAPTNRTEYIFLRIQSLLHIYVALRYPQQIIQIQLVPSDRRANLAAANPSIHFRLLPGFSNPTTIGLPTNERLSILLMVRRQIFQRGNFGMQYSGRRATSAIPQIRIESNRIESCGTGRFANSCPAEFRFHYTTYNSFYPANQPLYRTNTGRMKERTNQSIDRSDLPPGRMANAVLLAFQTLPVRACIHRDCSTTCTMNRFDLIRFDSFIHSFGTL
mmetsp:Transcript_24093/g.52775  ORF Transcript_24093/g.52775 Transcript_24093/m.52775 type:complete len:225 (+) Transcript_24093:1967-2641(+)